MIMTTSDFNRLLSLTMKLNSTAGRARATDTSFNKYNKQSIDHMLETIEHIKRLKQGLTTAKYISPDQEIDQDGYSRMSA